MRKKVGQMDLFSEAIPGDEVLRIALHLLLEEDESPVGLRAGYVWPKQSEAEAKSRHAEETRDHAEKQRAPLE